MQKGVEFTSEELAEAGGVTRRTVRYYVQEGLIPEPAGLGRGRHYGRIHLEQLLRVKRWQEQGRTLAEIRAHLRNGVRPGPVVEKFNVTVKREAWTRIALLPGLELHVAASVRIPPPGEMAALVDWCQRHFSRSERQGEHT